LEKDIGTGDRIMIKSYKVSWHQYTDPNIAHGDKVSNLLVMAGSKSMAKDTVAKILGRHYIQLWGVHNFVAEETHCYQGGKL
jgi:hypothetical protein